MTCGCSEQHADAYVNANTSVNASANGTQTGGSIMLLKPKFNPFLQGKQSKSSPKPCAQHAKKSKQSYNSRMTIVPSEKKSKDVKSPKTSKSSMSKKSKSDTGTGEYEERNMDQLRNVARDIYGFAPGQLKKDELIKELRKKH